VSFFLFALKIDGSALRRTKSKEKKTKAEGGRKKTPPFSYCTNRKTLKALLRKAFKVFLGLGLSAERCI
jgi:hypothetical protein